MIRRFLSSFLLLLMTTPIWGQDVHFSQFHKSYLNLSPALTGSFTGDYRVNMNYRNQWSSIAEPYRTFSTSAEGNKLLKKLPSLSMGLLVLTDEAGVGDLTTNQVNSSFAYLKKLNADSSLTGKIGIQLGFSSKRIDFDRFSFDAQYDGRGYDQTLGTNETFENNSFSYLNLNAGVGIEYRPEKKKTVEFGFALYNLTRPNQSFLNGSSDLNMRMNLFLKGSLDLSQKFDLLPALLYSAQDEFREFVIGSDLRYRFNKKVLMADGLNAGLWYRSADALILAAGLDYHQWNVGASYDINISELQTATRRQGGLELSFTYIFRSFKPVIRKYKVCPNFM